MNRDQHWRALLGDIALTYLTVAFCVLLTLFVGAIAAWVYRGVRWHKW